MGRTHTLAELKYSIEKIFRDNPTDGLVNAGNIKGQLSPGYAVIPMQMEGQVTGLAADTAAEGVYAAKSKVSIPQTFIDLGGQLYIGRHIDASDSLTSIDINLHNYSTGTDDIVHAVTPPTDGRAAIDVSQLSSGEYGVVYDVANASINNGATFSPLAVWLEYRW